jgi:hypothetical protein
MEINVGNRVSSSEVEMTDFGGVFQKKQLEIIELMPNEIVKCKYFNENEVNPKIEYYEVSKESLAFINEIPLKYKGLEQDPFFEI